MKLSTTVLSCVVLLIFSNLATRSEATSPLDVDIGLYHASTKQVGATECKTVRLPWNLCTACKLKPFTGSGANLNFGGVNRFDIYNLSSSACIRMIRTYVNNNKCDTTRKRALDNFEANKNVQAAYKTLIYFMYSVCETCCDCIPIGARANEYEQRKKDKTLIHIGRGNCAAHVHYDTCKIWPNAHQITNLKGKMFNNTNTKWCADFKTWQFSPDSKGWLKNNNVNGLTWKMRRAMNMIAKTARCTEETQWKNCVAMELAQKRL